MSCYLNEFRPLAKTLAGRHAIDRHKLKPFIDASCRREPDFESPWPSITALCRGPHLAPKLEEGDLVAYMTPALAYPQNTAPARRLVAVLRVKITWKPGKSEDGLQAHLRAAEWYRQQGLPLPSNCIVPGNDALPLEKTDRYNSNLRLWDRHYRDVAKAHGVFHCCEKIFCELNDPPKLTNRQLLDWFGTIPDTRKLPALPPSNFAKLLRCAGRAA